MALGASSLAGAARHGDSGGFGLAQRLSLR
jgi:hypothetical protein